MEKFIKVDAKHYVVTGLQSGNLVPFRAVKDGSGNYLAMIWFPCIVGVGVMLYSVPLIDTPAEDREPDLNIQVAKYFPCQGNV